MDLRWIAYAGSGLLAVISLFPVAVSRSPDGKAPTPGSVQRRAQSPAIPVLLDVERHTARLSSYHAEAPSPRLPARNPFRFVERRVPTPERVRPAAPVTFVPETPPAPRQPLTLVGMSSRRVGDTVQRTAVISGFADVYLVGANDRIRDRFTVLSIGDDAVELRDDDAQAFVRLTLPSGR
jgi:hypothetical protein